MRSGFRLIPLMLCLILLVFGGVEGQQITHSPGLVRQQGFLMDNVLTTEDGVFHYNLYVPESYDGTRPYALHMALPGWEGLYFQGLGEDLRWEYLRSSRKAACFRRPASPRG